VIELSNKIGQDVLGTTPKTPKISLTDIERKVYEKIASNPGNWLEAYRGSGWEERAIKRLSEKGIVKIVEGKLFPDTWTEKQISEYLEIEKKKAADFIKEYIEKEYINPLLQKFKEPEAKNLIRQMDERSLNALKELSTKSDDILSESYNVKDLGDGKLEIVIDRVVSSLRLGLDAVGSNIEWRNQSENLKLEKVAVEFLDVEPTEEKGKIHYHYILSYDPLRTKIKTLMRGIL
jgi:hypothetical protein